MLCPFAKQRLMPYSDRLPKREASKTLILHTNGGGTDNGSLYGWFSRPGNDISSHFQVAKDGTIEQYVDTKHQAYAQYSGNEFGVSVETEDDGHPETPWTAAQLRSINRLAKWLGCPPVVSPDGKGGGIGWHSLYADWNRSGHNCPGSVRVAQIHSHVIPALLAGRKSAPKGHPHPTPLTAQQRREVDDLIKHPPADPGMHAEKRLGRLARLIARLRGRK